MKKIGIIGTRRRNTGSAYKKTEEEFFKVYEDGDHIVSGGCPKGGDRFAEKIAKKVLKEFDIISVDVTIRKLRPSLSGVVDFVEITISRKKKK